MQQYLHQQQRLHSNALQLLRIPEPRAGEVESRCSPPASSCSTGTAASDGPAALSPSKSGETSCHSSQETQQAGISSMLQSSHASSQHTIRVQSSPHPPAGGYTSNRDWLYRLVTFPSYFTPCTSCCGGSRTPKREQLMTQFDTQFPYSVYCSHCPDSRTRSSTLLQVRRSAFKDVVKASDILRFGADVAGVQQYTLNGSKVIYLNREQTPEKKLASTSTAPAQCSVDGRAMMDKSSQYCSLKCKMHAEDPTFNAWLDQQDPSVRILAQAAANAPPRPTAASKRVHGSSYSVDGSTQSAKARKLARIYSSSGMAAAGAPAGCPSSGDSVPASAVPSPSHQLALGYPSMHRAASAIVTSSAAILRNPAGLKPVRTGVSANRQQSVPSAFLEAAMSDPLLLPSTTTTVLGMSSAEFDVSNFACWDSEMSTPSLLDMDTLDSLSWDEQGGLSEALIESSTEDWWMTAGAAPTSVAVDQQDEEEDEEAGLLITGLGCLSGASLLC